MPFKNKVDKQRWSREYYQRKRRELIDKLGSKCVECGEDDLTRLEAHHIVPICRRSRPFKEAMDPKGKELRCTVDHKHTEGYRRRRKRRTAL